ncbi:tRNA 2-thiouridine(34) synthase MnmA [Wohlfahrtiimonas chitiniclastica]|uniref:tRNA 2-thiouridine(34) synthase MnmA n=1 Tax=Wohlfahrtiimonas chitiniclastica TaxID=400946 RepID=UPI001BCECD52|nr:tRNA 2-thiouridine(34) synthase MnmA [Wohlfahrtiimonas chitiniclastica]MBS7827890.1 tRNA 2-thiouridine(34) synthase MnmA [Wohlfahrtiimonas chitiniclastica]
MIQEDIKGKRVIVGMSGGVDSSVAALLLKEQGADVHGVFMKNWEDNFETGYCSAEEDVKDAQAVCDTLGIPLHKVNFVKNYKERVFAYFLETLKLGLTPNPDVLCNKEIKFKAFLDYANEMGADYIATGHYARTHRADGQTYLLKGLDNNKDQSYFLHLLSQAQIKNALFPVGELEKPVVRELALKHKLITYDKKDSTGICFIGERDFNEFIGQYIASKPGKMITVDGEVIGEHQGLSFYTIGQRKGLHIGGVKNSTGEPWFVVEKNLEDNTLIVAQGEHPALYKESLTARDVHWINTNLDLNAINENLTAKIRYRQKDEACHIEFLDDGRLFVAFDDPQRAVTPGQSIVFYHGDVCLGGAIIER